MIIRQPFIDSSGKQHIKEVKITLEEIRSPGLPATQPALVATCDGHIATCSPLEEIAAIMDSRRNYVPFGRHQTKLASRFDGGVFNVKDATKSGLDAKIGDPLAVMTSADGKDIGFYLVGGVDGNRVMVTGTNRRYLAGSIIQNLRSRWWAPGQIGVCTAVCRPDALPFMATPEGTAILVSITVPMNRGNIAAYDIYLRTKTFKQIEEHWVPDCENTDIDQDQILVSSCDGGVEAGGCLIQTDATYYLTVVSKDDTGNESAVKFVETVYT